MPRRIEDLEAHAFKFWPAALAQHERSTSIIPKLIESQEKFIGILYVADACPEAWKNVLRATEGMPGNLFLKHLIVLSDLGGEKLQRCRTGIGSFFPAGKMTFRWKDAQHTYAFRSLDACRVWTNDVLRVDGVGLETATDLSDAMEDVAMLLLHAGASTDPAVPREIADKCMIGSLIGRRRAGGGESLTALSASATSMSVASPAHHRRRSGK